MQNDLNALATLSSDETVRDMFKLIVEHRRIRYAELSDRFGHQKADEIVTKLLEAKLIEEKPAPVPEYRMYYVTREGLFAARQLSRVAR